MEAAEKERAALYCAAFHISLATFIQSPHSQAAVA